MQLRAHSQEQQLIMQYLLGQAEPMDSSRFEELLITNKEFYDELIIAEDELIDQYLDGDLTALERKQFESHFLFSVERHQKVRFGRALLHAANASEHQSVEMINGHSRSLANPPRMSSFPLHLLRSNAVLSYSVLALLLFVGIGLWAIWSNFKQPHVGVPGKTVAISLLPGSIRSDQPTNNRISKLADIETIQLRLALVNTEETYRVKVMNEEQREVWSGDGVLQTDGGHSFVVANVPAQSLPYSDYKVTLTRKLADGSFEEVLNYSFSVVP